MNAPYCKSRKSRLANAVKQIWINTSTKYSTMRPKQSIFRSSFSIVGIFFSVSEKDQMRYFQFLPVIAHLNFVMKK